MDISRSSARKPAQNCLSSEERKGARFTILKRAAKGGWVVLLLISHSRQNWVMEIGTMSSLQRLGLKLQAKERRNKGK